MSFLRVAILANVPVWTIPGLEHLHRAGHYATWLEPLVPAFERIPGIDVHWITMCKEVSEPVTYECYGQTVHILPRRSMGWSMVTGYLLETRRIHRLLRWLEPDVVHAWGTEDVYGLAAAFGPGSSKLFSLQGCLTHYLKMIGGNALFRLQALYERPTVARFRYATGESPAARDLLLGLNPQLEVAIVDYGVSPAFFDACWEPSPEPEVLFVGSVSNRKGAHDLIAIAGDPALAGIRFKIVGDGELRSELEAASSSNVEWIGKCDRAGVIRHLSSAWCLVVPTYADTGPSVIKEARVVGLPVITTTAAGASCYIRDGISGYVSEPGDREALVRSIVHSCGSRENAVAMGRDGWELARTTLCPETTAGKFAAIYRQLIGYSEQSKA